MTNIGTIQRRDGARLALEALGVLFGGNFDRDIAARAGVAGAIRFAHSASKVRSVGGTAIPGGATVIDVGDATLLPGFIDAHTHLTMDLNSDYNAAQLIGLQRTVAEQAIRVTENARKTLMAGFTTVRDVGSSDFLDVGLRNAINANVVPGPRMLVSVHALGSTGAATATMELVFGSALSITNPGLRTV